VNAATLGTGDFVTNTCKWFVEMPECPGCGDHLTSVGCFVSEDNDMLAMNVKRHSSLPYFFIIYIQ
jgi:hypothetical protein